SAPTIVVGFHRENISLPSESDIFVSQKEVIARALLFLMTCDPRTSLRSVLFLPFCDDRQQMVKIPDTVGNILAHPTVSFL
ncbi:MAG: hypothetical protein ACD_13C00283G0001, partial [uncultured bacterium]